MDKVICVRHGHSEYMVKGLTGGWTDAPLTELGRKQAWYTGKKLQKMLDSPFDFYSSDLKRAAQTAEIVAKMLNKKPVLISDLREHNNGRAANCTREKAEKMKFPVTKPIMDWIPYPEAESWRMLHKRVTQFLDRIHNAETVLLVAHSMVIVSVIHWWLEFDEDIITRVSYDVDLCSITQLYINEWNEKTIAKLNDTSHLTLSKS